MYFLYPKGSVPGVEMGSGDRRRGDTGKFGWGKYGLNMFYTVSIILGRKLQEGLHFGREEYYKLVLNIFKYIYKIFSLDYVFSIIQEIKGLRHYVLLFTYLCTFHLEGFGQTALMGFSKHSRLILLCDLHQ